MKTFQLVLLVLFFSIITLSCSKENKIKTVEVSIKGMTCEIGCARLIQSKVAKEKGVSYANVSFKDKKGVFTYDPTITSEEIIIEKINNIADGTLYKVTSKKQLDSVYTQKQ